jgi:hypothetical protein
MPQEFKAIICETRDTSRWIDVENLRTGETKREEWSKSARFTLESTGPCPWPPGQLQGKVVRIVIDD